MENNNKNRTHLHDELNGPDKVHEELEDEVLLFLLHLIEAILLAPGLDLGVGETGAGVGVEHLFGHGTGSTGFGDLFLFDLTAILGLEIINKSINVFDLVFVDDLGLDLGRRRTDRLAASVRVVGGRQTERLFWVVAGVRGGSQATGGDVGAEVVGRRAVRAGGSGRRRGCGAGGHRHAMIDGMRLMDGPRDGINGVGHRGDERRHSERVCASTAL